MNTTRCRTTRCPLLTYDRSVLQHVLGIIRQQPVKVKRTLLQGCCIIKTHKAAAVQGMGGCQRGMRGVDLRR
jgi:hypothetical protein